MKKLRIRSAGIVIHNRSILLMHRKKGGREYYAIPGGGVEQNESAPEAALRELAEETSIEATIIRLLYTINTNKEHSQCEEFFYLCDYIAGEPKLASNAIERKKMLEGNQWYEPIWIPIDLLSSIELLPPIVKEWLIIDLKDGFLPEARTNF